MSNDCAQMVHFVDDCNDRTIITLFDDPSQLLRFHSTGSLLTGLG